MSRWHQDLGRGQAWSVGLGQGLACALAHCGLGWGLGLSLRLGSGLVCSFLPLALREAGWLRKGRVSSHTDVDCAETVSRSWLYSQLSLHYRMGIGSWVWARGENPHLYFPQGPCRAGLHSPLGEGRR